MMRYGLIGEKLGHSFSKIIHEKLADYTYDLIPLSLEELDVFMREKEFSAINVTIPYKETVIPYLDEVDPKAAKMGAVNTVVQRNGKLFGYNTDYFGFRYMLEHNHIQIAGKKVLVLGRGGASKAVIAVLEDMGAAEIHTIYYKIAEDSISYETCYALHTDAQVIVNTTACGHVPQFRAHTHRPDTFHQSGSRCRCCLQSSAYQTRFRRGRKRMPSHWRTGNACRTSKICR